MNSADWNSVLLNINSIKNDPNFLNINRDASRRVEITIRVKSNEQRAALQSNLKDLNK